MVDSFRNIDTFNEKELQVVMKEDYLLKIRKDFVNNTESVITLPESNVIKYFLSDGGFFVLRPSGTEPKMKLYISCCAKSKDETIKRNISEAAKSGMDLLIRVPLIGGVNTDQEIFDDFLLFFKEINSENVHFELLKYHEYGKDKWDKCGLTYAMANAFVEEKTRLDFETKMKNIGLKVVRT